MTTNEIVMLLQARGFRFTHSLGQNFLVDDDALGGIVSHAAVSGRNVLEIGAGAGCLTNALAKDAKKVLCIEIDAKLISVLETVLQPHKNVVVIEGDALKLDLAQLAQQHFDGEPFDVVANLPYYITTPILFALFEAQAPLQRICVMLQKEAVQRVIAKPSTKEYSPLAILCAYRADVEVVLDVPAHCFVPRPHVESTVITMDMRPYKTQVDEAAFMRLVKSCFLMRRKTLQNNLMSYGLTRQAAGDVISAAGLSASVRAEALTLDEFLTVFSSIRQINE